MNRSPAPRLFWLWLALIWFTFTPASAQQEPFKRVDAMIPMRDGVRLNTHIYSPARTDEQFPILILRTPYGIGNATPSQLATAVPELTSEGFIIVQQDIRGRFNSEGRFVMLRQPRDPKDKNAVDESSDTYDTIEWLLKNVANNNRRVGIAGTSYGAWLAVMAMLDPHPALNAVVEQASPADMWMGDDFHHNGAFRLSYGLEYAYMMESSKEIADAAELIDTFDTYEWYLKLGSLANVETKYFRGKIPSWRSMLRSTSRTVASTTTSGLLLSISSMIFSAIAILSGVSRTRIAFIAELWAMNRMFSSVRKAVIASVISVEVTLLVR